MQYYSPGEILELTVQKGVEKAALPAVKTLLLAFMGGLYIALGFLGYIRVAGTIPHEWGSFGTLLGASVFPVGLMGVLLAGGELITGNMMVVAAAFFKRKVSLARLGRNWALVTLGNFLGALFVAWFLGHLTGLAEGDFLGKTLATAAAKINDGFWPAFFSGIGCNIFVCLGVWLCYGAKDFAGKILGIFFPVMVFVAIGFQHVVANMFLIPEAIFSGGSSISWLQFGGNCLPVFLGNMCGGLLLAAVYCLAYGKKESAGQNA
ncbi:MAG: formate/nitrite transporter family protein [Oscillospiraceae bacterium]